MLSHPICEKKIPTNLVLGDVNKALGVRVGKQLIRGEFDRGVGAATSRINVSKALKGGIKVHAHALIDRKRADTADSMAN